MQPAVQEVTVTPVGCPRHATSVMLCPCHIVPSSHGKVLALSKDQYKIWKQNQKRRATK